MPTIEVNYNDLLSLVGKHIPLDVLQEEGILYAKGEIEEIDGEMLKIDIKDTNRPDLWSAEGIARELQGRYGVKLGAPRYEVKHSDLVVEVDGKLKNIRPVTVCAVVKGLNVTPDALSQMIQLQEKVSVTFGKNRKEVAIGVYDYHKITPPIRFTAVKPDGIRFVPLEFEKEMTPAEILKKHPKGLEYAHLLKGMPRYPIFMDAAGEVLSLPPIINSDYTGKVTSATRDVFIECSGFDFRFLNPALNVIVSALADRGGTVESVKVAFPDKVMHTPDLKPKRARVDSDYANRMTGLKLSPKRLCELLGQARYDAKVKGRAIGLLYPAYRQDVMHQRDVIEDIIISYGYNKVKPVMKKLATTGSVREIEKLSDSVAEVMVGLGFQEILSYVLTNRNNLFNKMNAPPQDVVEIENFVSSNWSVFRNWLLPSLLDFMSRNKHREFPQPIFEIGDAVTLDKSRETRTKDIRNMAAASCGNKVGYEYMASVLDALMSSLGLEYELVKAQHPSFIPGRTAQIRIKGKPAGIMGEIHPIVLNSWGLEKPAAALEIGLDGIL
ncbi:MAG: phenylalanine--tRNA ligase subunit beta [Candidatus Aenigmarchaeota archaeon]|nr:phenylalanine--tRNA ligase subunit beta [Candidatus Aenigmarchaeota archaeon]